MLGEERGEPLLRAAERAVEAGGAAPEEDELGLVVCVALDGGETGVEVDALGEGGTDGDELVAGLDGALLGGGAGFGKRGDEDAAAARVVLLEDDAHGLGEFRDDVVRLVHRVDEVVRDGVLLLLRLFRSDVDPQPSVERRHPVVFQNRHVLREGVLHAVEDALHSRQRRGALRGRGDQGRGARDDAEPPPRSAASHRRVRLTTTVPL
mmetsp:Transcript_7936/g.24378  ORF Transcript_7936/g.24378 Transcript_7936/m.24378 type:complete len:208 (+) Transcript_7936:3-626(+)